MWGRGALVSPQGSLRMQQRTGTGTGVACGAVCRCPRMHHGSENRTVPLRVAPGHQDPGGLVASPTPGHQTPPPPPGSHSLPEAPVFLSILSSSCFSREHDGCDAGKR